MSQITTSTKQHICCSRPAPNHWEIWEQSSFNSVPGVCFGFNAKTLHEQLIKINIFFINIFFLLFNVNFWIKKNYSNYGIKPTMHNI